MSMSSVPWSNSSCLSMVLRCLLEGLGNEVVLLDGQGEQRKIDGICSRKVRLAGEKFVLGGGQRDHRQPALADQRGVREDLIGFDFGEGNRLTDRFAS